MQKNLFALNLLSFAVFFLLNSSPLSAQLVVNGGQTPEQMIENFLGTGVVVDNVVINCSEVAYGTFDGSDSNIGIENGILLTTGSIDNAVGPNDTDGAQTNNDAPGDADLAAIVDQFTEDACILEFEFVPASNLLSFTYVFGSEEYLEWVDSNVNDVFAFFVTGPNPAGGSYEKQNIALLPGTDVPVSIDNVNDDTNSEFYVDNGDGDTVIDPTSTVQYDGFTVPLSVEIDLVPCETYQLKIAIADAGDGVWDSGVFLEAGSLNTDVINVTASTSIGTDTAVEGCLDGVFTFTSSAVLAEDLVIDLEISGSAENGSDYTNIPNTVTILAGETSASIVIEALEDEMSEGIEDITIRFDESLGCDGVEPTEATLFLTDSSIAGTTSVNLTVACDGETIVATSNDGFVKDGDVQTFVVHNSPNADTGMDGFTIYSINPTGAFLNDGGIPRNIPLYISTVVGVNDGTGTPILTDLCLKVGEPIEVVFLEPITFVLEESCDVSTGDYMVAFELEGGYPEYNRDAVYTITGDYAGTYAFDGDAINVLYTAGTDNVYDFNVTDEMGCAASVVSDPFECVKNPIELLSFEGEIQETGNLLQWITATELDNDYFELSRSIDGKSYESIAIVKSQGNSENLQSYEFLDRNAPAGLAYYQLSQHDFNGQMTTFPVITLQRGEGTGLEIVQVLPIPARDFIGVSFTAAKNETLEIGLYNTSGQLVLSQIFTAQNGGVNTLQLDVQNLLSGVYLLSVANEKGRVSRMLVKE